MPKNHIRIKGKNILKKCITISGGFDSGCIPFLFQNIIDEYDFIFFNYNQNYLKHEKATALKLATKFKKNLIEIEMKDMTHDHERRNFLFIAKLKQLQYSEIMMGNRNLLPFFDKYKDSNFIYLKILGFLLFIKIKLPILGWNKKKILNFLKKNNYFDFYNCYNNSINFDNCDCRNCLEIKKWGTHEK